MEYNPIFSRTSQGGDKKLSNSKWLVANTIDADLCPVRLYRKLISKRGQNITTQRLFLTVNPNWKMGNWYKNCPIGKNTLSNWTKQAAQKIGLDTEKEKITNHSNRATAVSTLSKAGVSEQTLIKITGHSSAASIKPYLQMDKTHHENTIQGLRGHPPTNGLDQHEAPVSCSSKSFQQHQQATTVYYNNCVFNNNTYN